MARELNIATSFKSDSWWTKVLRQVIFYILLFVIWEAVGRSGIWPYYAFPTPSAVFTSLIEHFQDNSLTQAILVSVGRLLVGYLIALVIGVVVGILIGSNKLLAETFGSLILGLQALPSICWLPLAVLWFGLTEQAVIFVVVMGALFSIALGVDSGVQNTPPLYLKAARNMGARGFALATQVVLPAALPSIIAGLKQGWTFAWRSLMAAELLYVTVSLGGLLDNGRNLQDIALVMAVMIVIIVIGIIIDRAVFSPFERRMRERWGLVVGK